MLTNRAIPFALIAAVASMALAACGSKAPKAPKPTGTATGASPPPPVSVSVLEQVVVSSSHSTAKFGSRTAAHPGDNVAMRTNFEGSNHSGTTPVTVSVSRRSASTLKVTANADGHSSQATIASPDGKPIKLAYVRYLCYLPPTATFCHAVHAATSPAEYVLHFQAPVNMPLDLIASVESPGGPTGPPAPHGTQPAPPFKPSQQVRAELPGGTTGPYASFVRIKPGMTLDLLTQLNSAPVSAKPQTATLTIDRGPGKTLHVSATVDGGPASSATIASADGKPIKLTLPRYQCYAPPAATFCPAKDKSVSPQNYTVKFPALPGVPIALFASSQ